MSEVTSLGASNQLNQEVGQDVEIELSIEAVSPVSARSDSHSCHYIHSDDPWRPNTTSPFVNSTGTARQPG